MMKIKKWIKKYIVINSREYNLRKALKKGMIVGKNSRLYTSNFGSEPYLIIIGSDVTISNNTQFITHDGAIAVFRHREGFSNSEIFGKITIGDNVFVGANCTILPNTNISPNVIIGACSLVKGNLQSNYVYAGVPIKKICTLEEYFEKNKRNIFQTKKFSETRKAEILKSELYE